MSIERKKRQIAMLNKKIMKSEKIQSPYSRATIIRTIPLRFRLPNSLPPQKDDIWGSGGGGVTNQTQNWNTAMGPTAY